MRTKLPILLTGVLLITLAACKPSDPTIEPTEAAPVTPTTAVTTTPTDIPVPVPPPEEIEMELEDGSVLAGTYYAPAIARAPGILLVHGVGEDRSAWAPLIARLTAQVSPSAPTYAVLAYDLPGLGASEGQTTITAIRESIQVALETMYENPDVNQRVIIIGADAGADGAVSECALGCIGSVSLSPGDYLRLGYTITMNDVIRPKGAAVLCIAADLDFPAPGTCEGGAQANITDYQLKIYNGYTHGTDLLTANIQPGPPPIDLIMDWIVRHHPLK